MPILSQIYVQPAQRNGLPLGRMFFRYFLSGNYHQHLQEEFTLGEPSRFSIDVFLILPNNEIEIRPLVKKQKNGKVPENGVKLDWSKPTTHLDQRYFSVFKQEIDDALDQIQQDINNKTVLEILKVEVHSTLIPCTDKTHDCATKLQNTLPKLFQRFFNNKFDQKHIWVISYAPEDQEYDKNTGGKKALAEGAFATRARRLKNLGHANYDPENGRLRCITECNPDKLYSGSKFVEDRSKEYHRLVAQYQQDCKQRPHKK